MSKIYLCAIYLLVSRSAILDEEENNLTNVDLDNKNDNLSVDEDSLRENLSTDANESLNKLENEDYDNIKKFENAFKDFVRQIEKNLLTENKNDNLSVDEDSIRENLSTDANESLNKLENEEYDDIKKYENFYKIFSCLVEKNLLTEKEMNKLFCLDLNFGSEWRKKILTNLDFCFKKTGLEFGCFLLHSCLERLRDDRLDGFYFAFLISDEFDRDISFEVNENIKLNDLQTKRLKIIINELYYKEARYSPKTINYNNLDITLNPSGLIYGHRTYESVLGNTFLYKFPKILFSADVILHLMPQIECLKLMLQSGVPTNVGFEKLDNYPEIKNYLKSLGIVDVIVLNDSINNGLYQEYYKFITKIFSSKDNKIILDA